MKKHTIMGIFAHPDDETFGPGGTLIKYAAEGHNTAVLTATHGQAGRAAGLTVESTVGDIRKKEAKKAAEILGLHTHLMLNFYDGTLNEAQIPPLQDFILTAVNEINPDIIIIYEPGGISMHLDHIAVSKAVMKLWQAKEIRPKKIYYFGLPREMMAQMGRDGGLPPDKQATIDVSEYLEKKREAMMAHESQRKDWEMLFARMEEMKKAGQKYLSHEYFSLAGTELKGLSFPESDLLAGL